MTEKPSHGLEAEAGYARWPVGRLLSMALSESDEEVVDDLICALGMRGTREVFDQAVPLCQSTCHVERALGIRILGSLGECNHRFISDCFEVVLGSLNGEREENVIHAILQGFGKLHRYESIEPASRFRHHPNPEIRRAVVSAMLHREDALAVETLIGLTRDSEADTREWASFGLGSCIEWDSDALRDALAERLMDEDGYVRGDAIHGLAARGDSRVVPYLLEALTKPEPYNRELEAATLIADPALLPLLIALPEEGEDYYASTRTEAIEACTQAVSLASKGAGVPFKS